MADGWDQHALGMSLVAIVLAWPAHAAGPRDYDDCHQSNDQNRRIAGCTRILQDSEETPQNRAITYNSRGFAYYTDKEDYDRAIADYSEAIRLDPKYESAYVNRAEAYAAKGDNNRANGDFNEAIRLDPKNIGIYLTRGSIYFRGGSFAKAQADFKRAAELGPKYAHIALMLDLAERRNGLPSRLSRTTSELDTKAWPAPVVRLMLGEITPAALLAAADDGDPEKKRHQVCTANFFSGELAILQGAKDEALRLFRLAASDCPQARSERSYAKAELRALGVRP
jgi:lipoprotein NlpI